MGSIMEHIIRATRFHDAAIRASLRAMKCIEVKPMSGLEDVTIERAMAYLRSSLLQATTYLEKITEILQENEAQNQDWEETDGEI